MVTLTPFISSGPTSVAVEDAGMSLIIGPRGPTGLQGPIGATGPQGPADPSGGGGAWADWTPFFTYNVYMTFTEVEIYWARYTQIGKTVFWVMSIGGTLGNHASYSIAVGLPVVPSFLGFDIGHSLLLVNNANIATVGRAELDWYGVAADVILLDGTNFTLGRVDFEGQGFYEAE
jgi:hypothetical protein